MKIKTFFTFVFVILLLSTIAAAEVFPFDYTFAVPSSADLTKEEAEAIADTYFSSHSDRIVIYHEDVAQYEKTTNFIRIAQQNGPMYCWAVAYNDGNNMYARYGFVGMVIVSSPDGRIVDYCSDSYWECFADWESVLTSTARSSAEIWGAIDLIALPEGNRVKHVMPDMYTIREEEALKIANQLVAGYQRIAANDVKLDFDISATLDRNLLVSEYPIWSFRYVCYQDTQTETRVPSYLQYTVAIYAHTGNVWYVIDHMSNQVIYADHSCCHLPLSEEDFEPAEWQLSDYELLFGKT